VLDVTGLSWLPVRRSWRLNERHYGALQGKDKARSRAVRRRAVHELAPLLRHAAAADSRRRPALRGARSFAPVTRGGRYLDQDAAAVAAEAVKNQGRRE
jgi:hypothetical protein